MDARGPQEGFFEAFKLWKSFQDSWPENNENKVLEYWQGIMFMSQLKGKAIIICKKVPDDVVKSSEGTMTSARAIHKFDPLSAIKSPYAKSAVLQALREAGEV